MDQALPNDRRTPLECEAAQKLYIESIRILMADDDEDDRLLMQEAMDEVKLGNKIDFVEDGEELMQFLRREGKYKTLKGELMPGLILIDLNMPKKDGRQALKEIKSDPLLKRIPVSILTTSKAEEDVIRTYDLGVNSFLTKPVSFESLVAVMRTVTDYWLHIVRLPPR